MINCREGHLYAPPGMERVTPLEEIPPQFQKEVRLSANNVQIIDTRLCYNWEPGKDGGRYVECGSIASDADKVELMLLVQHFKTAY